jgi:hypothetical protein
MQLSGPWDETLRIRGIRMTEVRQLVQDRDTNIDERIAQGEAFLSDQRSRLLSAMLRAVAPLLIGVALTILWRVQVVSSYFGWIGMTIAALAVLAGAIILAQELAKSADVRSELSILRTRQKALRHLDPVSSSGDSDSQSTDSYFNSLVTINVENLAAYYGLVKVHTDKSFRVAIAVGIAGFALIAVGLAFGFTNDASDRAVSYIATASGIVVEFISGVFFYLYNRTVRQMKDYHDSLLAVQNILLSFKLVGDTKDDSEKAKMVAQMLAYLVGKRTGSPAANGEQPPEAILNKLSQS